MTGYTPSREADYCYRHPNRLSYILCQRCTKTVCTDCQTPAAVGVHCPDCVKEARKNQPNTVRYLKTGQNFLWGVPVTIILLVTMAALFLFQQISPSVTSSLWYAGLYSEPWGYYEPWRMITSAFVHSPNGYTHIIFNLLSLWMLGSTLEKAIGGVRFAGLFFVAVLGGSVAIQLFEHPLVPVVGASGGIFGLFGAYLLFSKKLTGTIPPTLLIILGLNLVFGFVFTGIAWQAHLGGLIIGVILAALMLKDRSANNIWMQLKWPAVLGVSLYAISLLATFF